MATKNGSWYSGAGYNAFRAVMDYSISSQNDTQAVVSVAVKCQMGDGHDAGYNFTGQTNIGGTTHSSDGSGYYDSGTTHTIRTDTKTIAKTHSTQTVSCSAKVTSTYAWSGSSSTASASVTIPAKTSYAVTYDANGGSGAPSSQTKWYGEALTLSSTRPTRANYNFKGWATSSTATSATCQPGDSYTNNAALTLFAVWELAYVAPTISSLSVYRSDTDGNRDSNSTTALTFVVDWSLNQTGGTNDSGTIRFSYGSTNIDEAISGTSGTTTKVVTGNFPAASVYSIKALLTDEHGLTATRSARVGSVFHVLQFGNEGKTASFFGAVDAALSYVLKIFGSLHMVGVNPTHLMRGTSFVGQIGQEIPESLSPLLSQLGYDAENSMVWYSQIMKSAADSLYRSFVLQRKDSSSDTVYHGFYLHLDSQGTPVLSFTTNKNKPVKAAWHQAISGWTQLAAATGTTVMTYDLTNYSEVMFTAICSTTANSAQVYTGSVVIPTDHLHATTVREVYLGGSYNGSGTYGRGFGVKATSTSATPTIAMVDGTDRASATTWRVLAR